MEDMGQPNGPKVSFTSMAEGTREDYELLDRLEEEFVAGTGDRVLAHPVNCPARWQATKSIGWSILFKPRPGPIATARTRRWWWRRSCTTSTT